MKRFLTIFILLAAAACESDADKLKRLEHDQAIAYLGVLRGKQVTDSLYGVIAQLEPDKYPSHRARYDSAAARLDTVRDVYAHARIAYKRASDGIEKLVGHE